MRLYRFRAGDRGRASGEGSPEAYASGTRAFLVHATRIGQPASDEAFQAMMTRDEDTELRPGYRAVVTITAADSEAPDYRDAVQRFTLRGGGSGHGTDARQVYTVQPPVVAGRRH